MFWFFFCLFVRLSSCVTSYQEQRQLRRSKSKGAARRLLYLDSLGLWRDKSSSSRQDWVKTDYYPNSNWFHITLGFGLQWRCCCHDAFQKTVFKAVISQASSSSRQSPRNRREKVIRWGRKRLCVCFGVACDTDWPITIYFLWNVYVMNLSLAWDWIRWTAAWCQSATMQFHLPRSSRTAIRTNTHSIKFIYIGDAYQEIYIILYHIPS